jgi:hypothetical protein
LPFKCNLRRYSMEARAKIEEDLFTRVPLSKVRGSTYKPFCL